MIDSLATLLEAAMAPSEPSSGSGSARGEYVLVTLHRPSLVDDADLLARTLEVLGEVAAAPPGA